MISRATHYGGYQSYGQKPITTLKPGQSSLERQYYGQVVNEPSEGYLTTYNRWNSVYGDKVSSTIAPNDFSVRTRRTLDAGKTIVSEDSKVMTSHWTTSYQNEYIEKDNSGRTKRPEWSYHQKPHQVRMPAEFYRSKYA